VRLRAATKAGQLRRSLALPLLAALLTLCMASLAVVEAASTSQHFQLAAQPTALAAGTSRSLSFALDSCVDNVMAGTGSSSNFRLQSGCGAILAQPMVFAEGIPADSPWALWLLALAVLLVAVHYLRPAGSSPA
jgi:hypothetical protein